MARDIHIIRWDLLCCQNTGDITRTDGVLFTFTNLVSDMNYSFLEHAQYHFCQKQYPRPKNIDNLIRRRQVNS